MRSGTGLIVRDVPEGTMFREISLIWETQAEESPLAWQ